MKKAAAEAIAAQFAVPTAGLPEPRDSFFPKHLIAVIGLKSDGRTRGLVAVRWGLIPNWYADLKQQPQPHNARAETVRTNGLFRESFARRRCLIPADGFFEWAPGPPRQRMALRPADGRLFGFAGVWDVWHDGEGGRPVHTACILTTTANDLVGTFHSRMPVILDPADYSRWLDPSSDLDELDTLMRSYPSDRMTCRPDDPPPRAKRRPPPDAETV